MSPGYNEMPVMKHSECGMIQRNSYKHVISIFQVVVSMGAYSILSHAINAFLEEGDEVRTL